MSEESKKEAQDAELNPEKLDKVAGGIEIEEVGDELYKCPNCGRTFMFKYQLEDHFCQTMGPYKPSEPLRCPKCGSTNLSITKVYSENHGDFTCKDCGNFFTIQL